MIKRILLSAIILGAGLIAPSAEAASITTLFARDNGSSIGGAVYFDITVAGNAVNVTGFTTNTAETDPFTWEVFLTAAGTSAFGNETNAGAWTSVSTGSGTGLGLDLASVVNLNNSFTLQANSSYGIAFVITGAGHDYTNGTGTNQAYSNVDLALSLGSASNSPFTAGINTPRVWNGSITYDVGSVSDVPEPTSLLLLGGGLLALAYRRRKA